MEWTTISFVGLPLLGVIIIGLLWRHFRGARFSITQQTVHCPLHDQDAHLAVRTKYTASGRQRHVDVTACSLRHREPVVPPKRVVWVPDLPYSDLRFQAGKPTPIHIGEVPCRKDCLHLLNLADGKGVMGKKRCVFGVMDCPELVREATDNTASETSALRAPWSYI